MFIINLEAPCSLLLLLYYKYGNACTVFGHREFTNSGRGDRVDRMEVEQGDGEGQRARLEDLEQEKAALLEQNKDLQERNRELQVHVCQLLSELLHKKECCHHNYGVTSTNMYMYMYFTCTYFISPFTLQIP